MGSKNWQTSYLTLFGFWDDVNSSLPVSDALSIWHPKDRDPS